MTRLPSNTELLTETELLYDSTVSVDVLLLELTEEVTSVTNHLEKTSSGVVILLVDLQMFGKVVDSLGENCDLNLRRTSIVLACFVSCDNRSFFFFLHHSKNTSLKIFSVT